jgi:hypothetical protein
MSMDIHINIVFGFEVPLDFEDYANVPDMDIVRGTWHGENAYEYAIAGLVIRTEENENLFTKVTDTQDLSVEKLQSRMDELYPQFLDNIKDMEDELGNYPDKCPKCSLFIITSIS